jgi:predicted amidophosphoribosyltransferase
MALATNPKFYCENCGAEVPLLAKSCPQCGRSFTSVRCPSCGFTGEESLFRRGCPICGFSLKKAEKEKQKQLQQKQVSQTANETGGLPSWVYFLIALAFTAVIIGFFIAM